MGLSFQTGDAYGYKMLKIFKVPANLINAADNAGVTVKTTVPGSFVVSSSDGLVSSVVPIKAAAISMAQNGTLGPSSMGAVTAQFVVSIQKALGVVVDATAVFPKPTGAVLESNDTLAAPFFPAPPVNKETDVLKAATDPVPVANATFLKNTASAPPPAPGTAKSLQLATNLLQPVKGTSHTSVYFVAALMKGVNIAIRNKSESLSVRVEGIGLSSASEALESMGFSVNHSYASAHFKTADPELKVKTLGAVIAGIGMEKLVQVANLNKMVGA